jgi:DNA-binding response OmpR family regulator
MSASFDKTTGLGLAPAHIVIVDDDSDVRDIIRACLEPEGYKVSEAATEVELLRILQREPVDLLTLDLKLHHEDGLAVARRIRQKYPVAIIIITGKGETVDRIVGLELGADDYISKPFHVREVLARVRSVLRRNAPAVADDPQVRRYVFGGWVLDCLTRELESPNGHKLRLTASEFELLEAFLANPNRVLSREDIMELTRGAPRFGNDRLIDNQVGRLKRKMASVHEVQGIIQSVRGAGYILTATVNR